MMQKTDVWFVYDGDCPICAKAVHIYRIKDVIGELHVVDARQYFDHPVYREICDRGLSLDEGMVIKFQDEFFHGEDALHLMALIGSRSGLINRLNCLVFRSKILARIFYPVMKSCRNLLLYFRGVEKIRNTKATEQS